MIETIFSLLGLEQGSVHIDENVLFCVAALLLFYCLGFMFNFFQTLMERLTAKKG